MSERSDLFDLNNSKTIRLYKDETPNNVITESMHIRTKLYHYVLVKHEPDSKTTNSKHKRVSKKGMYEMATDTYTLLPKV